jgi:AcrR family transcriptional regulator
MAGKKAGGTREKLLAAASEVFLAKGFRDATVAEICNRAGANIAAVNYHFGSKETLYQEAWRHAFSQSTQAHPQDGGVSAQAPVEERLRGQLTALMERIADEDNQAFLISQMEFLNPTGLLSEVMRAELIPLREKTLAVMRELLGQEASERQVNFCEICTISMCLHPMLIQRASKKARELQGPIVIDDLGAFVDHVMRFALAGIAAIRNECRGPGATARADRAPMPPARGLTP